jgi:hypothetical protein
MKRFALVIFLAFALAGCKTTGDGKGVGLKGPGPSRVDTLGMYMDCVMDKALVKIDSSTDVDFIRAEIEGAQSSCEKELHAYTRKAEQAVKDRHNWRNLKAWVQKDARDNARQEIRNGLVAASLFVNMGLREKEVQK